MTFPHPLRSSSMRPRPHTPVLGSPMSAPPPHPIPIPMRPSARRRPPRIWPQRAVLRAALVVSAALFLLAIWGLSGAIWRPSPLARARTPRPHRAPPRNETRSEPRHAGVSRSLHPNGGYTKGPLPSLREAFEHLRPRINAVRDRTPAVPAEHDLTSPIFAPFLSATLRERYAHLAPRFDEHGPVPGTERRILLVAVCRQVAGMLADWFATWTVLADFLGPESLVISLVEGGSDDGSGELLAGALRDHLLFIGVPPGNIFLQTNSPPLDWDHSHRIELLARMRNEAMAPIFESDTPHLAPDGRAWTHVVWHNDVYFGAGHVLELLHQHERQDSDITCGWDHAGKWFYDGWVGRDMSGDLYSPFPVPKEDEDKPAKFFVSSPATQERHDRLLPYQVFSGWNGMLVINPVPFAPPYNVRFRRGVARRADQREGEEECQASESMFISLDFWKYGFGRVLTVPGVHLTYGKGDTRTRGWVELPRPEGKFREEVDWVDAPPEKVRCHDWPDKIGKSLWAWSTVRWTDPPALEIPDPDTPRPPPGRKSTMGGAIDARTDNGTRTEFESTVERRETLVLTREGKEESLVVAP